jgi:hypothetical protein
MKKLLLSLLLFTSVILAQSGASIFDPTSGVNYQLILSIGINTGTGEIEYRNQKGERISGIDLSNYFVKKSDYNNLISNYDTMFPYFFSGANFNYINRGDIPYIDVAQQGGEDVNIQAASIDYLLGAYSNLYGNLLTRIKTLEDSVAATSIYLYGGSGLVTLQPVYAFYYSPVNFSNVVRSDTTMTRYIKNAGTGTLSVFNVTMSATNVGELYANPFTIAYDSCYSIAAGDSEEVYIRFKPSLARNNYLHEWEAFVSHNGGTNQARKTDSFYVQGTYIPDPIINPVDTANYYVDATLGSDDCVICNLRSTPLKTITKALSLAKAGDVIGLKAGETFTEPIVITKDSITIKSYGSGAKPVITLIDAIAGTNVSGNWEEISTNVWACDVTGMTYEMVRLFTDANYTDYGTKTYDLSEINTTDNWFCESGLLYVYSVGNPAQQFYSPYDLANGQASDQYTVSITADNVTLDSLDIRAGFRTVVLNYADNYIIKN